MGLTFGQKSSEYVPPVIDPDDIWIKTIKVGDTKVRFLEPTGDWITYREHYDPTVRKSFPCTEDNTCVGCQSKNERTKGKQRRYAFNALNEGGLLNVYKIGKKFRDQLVGREQRAETLLDRQYLLIRTGTTMEDTTYAYEALDREPLDWDGELHDIQKILGQQYMQYLEALAGNEGTEDADAAHEGNVTSIDKGKDKTEPKGEKSDEAQNGWGDPGFSAIPDDALAEPVEDWPLSRLKAYCDEHSIEFPLRASKNTLIPLVEEHRAKSA